MTHYDTALTHGGLATALSRTIAKTERGRGAEGKEGKEGKEGEEGREGGEGGEGKDAAFTVDILLDAIRTAEMCPVPLTSHYEVRTRRRKKERKNLY